MIRSRIILIPAVLALAGCAHGLPQRDLRPELAQANGYLVDQMQSAERGAVAYYVSKVCSNGGWGWPAANCKAPVAKTTAAAPLPPSKDTDGDGIADASDHCANTPAGAKINAFGCQLTEKVSIKLNVPFNSGSANFAANELGQLNDLAETLKANPNVVIRVEGHTDSAGAAALNQKLSANRASAVQKYLADRGVAEKQIHSEGYGATQPIAPNTTAAGRAKNRRVMATVIAQ